MVIEYFKYRIQNYSKFDKNNSAKNKWFVKSRAQQGEIIYKIIRDYY